MKQIMEYIKFTEIIMYMAATHCFILEKQTDKQLVKEFHRNIGGGILAIQTIYIFIAAD